MPDINLFKIAGTRIVPASRFNLEPARPSISFIGKREVLANSGFVVREHDIIRSIDLSETVLTPQAGEYYPRISGPDFDKNSVFNDHFQNNILLKFNDLEVKPFEGKVFYYEEILDSNGKNSGYNGYVNLQFEFVSSVLLQNERYIPLNLMECSLNLNVRNNDKDDIIKISGVIDLASSSLKFDLKDEAVKIAFMNLITGIDNKKCTMDFYFQFKAYSVLKRRIDIAREFGMINSVKLSRMNNISGMENRININKFRLEEDRAGRLDSIIEKPENSYTKTTYILKINKTVNFPLGTSQQASLYQTTGGGFVNNPFNQNNSFTEYQQIFVPGTSYGSLSVYKSSIQPNTFLLFSKKYIITRTSDDFTPSVSVLMHQNEDGTSTSEDISKVDFIFAVGPDLSEYDLAKLKISLLSNNFLDSDKNTDQLFSKIKFVYPTEIECDYKISGNALLNDAGLAIDGKNILFTLTKDHLSDASLIINAIDNSVSLYSNLAFKIKEIYETSIVEINIDKTGGDVLEKTVDNAAKTIMIKNRSLAKCKLNSLLLLSNDNTTYNNNSYFNKYAILDSNQVNVIDLKVVDKKTEDINISELFFDIEIIENIKQEFKQTINSAASFIKYIQLLPVSNKKNIAKMQVSITVLGTNSKLNFELLKQGKTFAPILISILTPTNMLSTKIMHETIFFDKNDNQISLKTGEFDFSLSAILEI